jgi:Mg2+-importing ATPase
MNGTPLVSSSPPPGLGISLEKAPPLPGLTDQEAAARLDRYGPNEPVHRSRLSAGREVVRTFTNPLTLILLAAATVSLFVGDVTDSIIIFIIVGLGAFLNFIQTYRASRAVEALRAQVAVTATVYRGGWKEIPRREVVPGDVVHISAGDMVPADAVLLEARDLHIQEAALTGESLPVEKSASPTRDPNELLARKQDLTAPDQVFLGTSVLDGSGTAFVRSTGGQTAFGAVAGRITTARPPTEFERGTRAFGTLITETTFVLVIILVLAGILLHRDPLSTLLFAVAIAVGLTPEFLPMIISVTLASGATRMARQQVIVKDLAAIQNFGSIDVLCSDKTGTLTKGEMSWESALDLNGNDSPRALELAQTNSRYQTGVANPMDQALLAVPYTPEPGEAKVDEIPFDYVRRRMSVVVDQGGTRRLITKGAPESLLPLCHRCEVSGGVVPLDARSTEAAQATFEKLSREGFRVLAVAYKEVPVQARYTRADEQDLTFVGYVAFGDPPLEEVGATLTAMADDGVQVKILTGDNEAVARHICRSVGMDPEPLLLGSEVDQLSDPALAARVSDVHVFARVSPLQKTRIVHALRKAGHVVGFLGDGVNDAPSMREADVGISVVTAVDVAKDAADFILMKRDLRVLHQGILEGRRAYGNVIKYILMGTSSNFGNMFSMAGAFFFLPFLPMLPDQILLNNLMYDVTQTTLPTDNVDPVFIRKPHRWDIKIIRNFMIYAGPISSIFDFSTFYVLLLFLPGDAVGFHTGWFVESLTTQTLVVFVIRTTLPPWKSRPSPLLVTAVISAVLVAWLLPYTPLAGPLGFEPLPLVILGFIVLFTVAYLGLMILARNRIMRPLTEPASASPAATGPAPPVHPEPGAPVPSGPVPGS